MGKSAKELRDPAELYRDYLKQIGAPGSPRDAHLFALKMRHAGQTFGREVRDLIIELEGSLPDYWQAD